jgi:prophage regulatory protein
MKYSKTKVAHGSAAARPSRPSSGDVRFSSSVTGTQPIRILRLAQVIDATGLHKTTIYELQAQGSFPMRVPITAYAVGWIEHEVQGWLAERAATRDLTTDVRPPRP